MKKVEGYISFDGQHFPTFYMCTEYEFLTLKKKNEIFLYTSNAVSKTILIENFSQFCLEDISKIVAKTPEAAKIVNSWFEEADRPLPFKTNSPFGPEGICAVRSEDGATWDEKFATSISEEEFNTFVLTANKIIDFCNKANCRFNCPYYNNIRNTCEIQWQLNTEHIPCAW